MRHGLKNQISPQVSFFKSQGFVFATNSLIFKRGKLKTQTYPTKFYSEAGSLGDPFRIYPSFIFFFFPGLDQKEQIADKLNSLHGYKDDKWVTI